MFNWAVPFGGVGCCQCLPKWFVANLFWVIFLIARQDGLWQKVSISQRGGGAIWAFTLFNEGEKGFPRDAIRNREWNDKIQFRFHF